MMIGAPRVLFFDDYLIMSCDTYQVNINIQAKVFKDMILDTQIGDSKLFAIAHDNLSMLKHLIEFENEAIAKKNYTEGTVLKTFEDSEEYPNFITPLILAAQCGRYEMIEYLLSRGDKIEKPHPSKCMCSNCRQAKLNSMDVVTVGCERLNVYAAISNPAYLCCTSSDPILKCFQLHHELLECGEVDQVYKNVYSEMAYKVNAFMYKIFLKIHFLLPLSLFLLFRVSHPIS